MINESFNIPLIKTLRILIITVAMIFIATNCSNLKRDNSGLYDELLLKLQNADGEAAFTVESELFDSLLTNPNNFYKAFSHNTELFCQFVDFLESGIFTNFNDTTIAGLEEKRTGALNMLENSDINPEYSAMHEIVVGYLDRLRPGFTD